MNIDNQIIFFTELIEKMAENGELGLAYFKERWPKLDNDDRKMLTALITVRVAQEVAITDRTFKQQLFWLAVANYTDKQIVDGEFIEDEKEDEFPKLSLGDGVNGNQITKIFRDLKRKNVITSSCELIAEGISMIFDIDYGTAYKDLTETKRMLKVLDLLP